MYNVGEHTLHALVACRADKILRLTMLLHDLGKPAAKVTDDRGYDHFPGHANISAEIAKDILKRLKFDNETSAIVTKLVKYHDYRPEPEPTAVRWALNKIGDELFPLFLEVQWADNSAKSEFGLDDKFDRVQAVCDVYEDVLKNRDCVKLSDLAMNGNDLLALGVQGKEIGRILNLALKLVVEDPDMNEHDSLVAFAKHEIEKKRS
jgi:tRNA nucleotidyltransferase (CCA-adding enzyme)